jgi:acetyltransferase-like isoleucine patch superfamily enzyme
LNFGPLARLGAIFSKGHLSIGKHPKMPYMPRFRWRDGTIRIGRRVSIGCGVVIDAQTGPIEVGEYVSFNDYTVVLGHGGVRIGNDVRIAAHVVIASFDHGFSSIDIPIRKQPVVKKQIVIEDDVWIGAGAKILGGTHIAKGCIIGANAVVKGSTVAYGIYVGAPARLLRVRNTEHDVTSERVRLIAEQ